MCKEIFEANWFKLCAWYGHGVGYYLNVHEGPQAISKNKIYLQEGMVVSNEPGYYEKNKFGIRIENLIYVKKTRIKTLKT